MEHRRNRGQQRKLNRATRMTRRTTRVIRSATVISVLATVVLLGGFAYGTYAALGGTVGSGTMETPTSTRTSAAEPAGKRTVHLVAVGDSLAHGFGDASGRGFVGDVANVYRRAGYAVVQSDLGIDGLTSQGLLVQLRQPSIQRLLAAADVVLISIGGNDLNDAAGLPKVNMRKVDRAENAFSAHLKAMVRSVRSVNPRRARIVMIGLYNPYGNVPATRMKTNAIIETWNANASSILSRDPKSLFVPTFDLFQEHLTQYLYTDHFHPNQVGYTRIANRIWQDLNP